MGNLMSADEPLSFTADVYNAYPSERVRFSARIDPAAMLPGRWAQVRLAGLLRIERIELARRDEGQRVGAGERDRQTWLRWEWDQPAPGPCAELTIEAWVSPDAPPAPTRAFAALLDSDGRVLFELGLQVMVKRMANSMRYLPEIYQDEGFANRFLMLLESFWNPISQQIDQVANYFDPFLAPPEMLAWLGAWFGLELEPGLPEARRRDLVAAISAINAQKGTRQGLETLLRMYSGGQVEISEHRDTNFVLGSDTLLGYQIALGTGNRPHSFDVRLTAPLSALPADGSPEDNRKRYRQRIEALINQYKPAHTLFALDLEFVE